jgi:hypothetical protein
MATTIQKEAIRTMAKDLERLKSQGDVFSSLEPPFPVENQEKELLERLRIFWENKKSQKGLRQIEQKPLATHSLTQEGIIEEKISPPTPQIPQKEELETKQKEEEIMKKLQEERRKIEELKEKLLAKEKEEKELQIKKAAEEKKAEETAQKEKIEKAILEKAGKEIREKREEILEEEEMRKIARERAKIDFELKKLEEAQGPFLEQEKKLREELEKLEEVIKSILNKEEKYQERKQEIEEMEKTAFLPQERKRAEKERWEVEKKLKEIVKERWEQEDKKILIEEKLVKLEEKIKDYSQRKAELQIKIAQLQEKEKEINLKKEKRKLQRENQNLEFQLKELQKNKAKILEKIRPFQERFEEISEREENLEKELAEISSKVPMAENLKEKKELEKKYWLLEEKRKAIERERWRVEDEKEKFEKELKSLEAQIEEVQKNQDEIQLKIKEIDIELGILPLPEEPEEQIEIKKEFPKKEPELSPELSRKEIPRTQVLQKPISKEIPKETDQNFLVKKPIKIEKIEPQKPKEDLLLKKEEVAQIKTSPPAPPPPPPSPQTIPQKEELIEEVKAGEDLSEKPKETLSFAKPSFSEIKQKTPPPKLTPQIQINQSFKKTQSSEEEAKEKLKKARIEELKRRLKMIQEQEELKRSKFLEKLAQTSSEVKAPNLQAPFEIKPEAKEELIIKTVPQKQSTLGKLFARIMVIIISFTVLGLVAGFWYWLLFVKPNQQPPPPPPPPPPKPPEEEIIEPAKPVPLPIALTNVDETEILEIKHKNELLPKILDLLKKEREKEVLSRILVKDLPNNRFYNLAELFDALIVQTPQGFYDKIDKDNFDFLHHFLLKRGAKVSHHLAIVAKIKDQAGILDFFSDWEKNLEKDVESLSLLLGKQGPATQKSFKQLNYQKAIIRCLPFVAQQDFGICWSVFKNNFILTSSGESAKIIVEKIKTEKP